MMTTEIHQLSVAPPGFQKWERMGEGAGGVEANNGGKMTNWNSQM